MHILSRFLVNSTSEPEINRLDKPIETNPRRWGLIIIFFGALLLFAAAFAYSYQQTTTNTIPGMSFGGITVTQPYSYDVTTTPFRDYTLPLVLGGVALFVSGFALIVYKTK